MLSQKILFGKLRLRKMDNWKIYLRMNRYGMKELLEKEETKWKSVSHGWRTQNTKKVKYKKTHRIKLDTDTEYLKS